jgi:hypothetical protein
MGEVWKKVNNFYWIVRNTLAGPWVQLLQPLSSPFAARHQESKEKSAPTKA